MKLGHRGFSLIELMIALAVAGVLITLAIPAFTDTIRNNRLSAQANEFIYALKFARAEAIKRGVPVTICRSSNQTACTTGGTANWESGWIIFAENAGNLAALDTTAANFASGATLSSPIVLGSNVTVSGRTYVAGTVFSTGTVLPAAVTTATESVLVAHEALTGLSTLRGDNNVANTITFNSQGMVGAGVGTFVLCDNRGNGSPTNTLARAQARQLIVAFSGQTRITTPTSRAATTPVTADPVTCTP